MDATYEELIDIHAHQKQSPLEMYPSVAMFDRESVFYN